MTDASGWAQLGHGLWRSRKRRRAGPVSEIRAALVEVRESMNQVVAYGGGMHQGLVQKENSHDVTLSDLAGRPSDKELKQLLQGISKQWRTVFASSRHARAGDYMVGVPIDPAAARIDAKRAEIQQTAARQGLELVVKAIDRLNYLKRKAL